MRHARRLLTVQYSGEDLHWNDQLTTSLLTVPTEVTPTDHQSLKDRYRENPMNRAVAERKQMALIQPV